MDDDACRRPLGLSPPALTTMRDADTTSGSAYSGGAASAEVAVLVYDGACDFCARAATWIDKRLPDGVKVLPWQALDLETVGLSSEEARAAAWWVQRDGESLLRCRGHEAIGRALACSEGAWSIVGRVISLRAMRWPSWAVYALVARNRHRLRAVGRS